MAPFLLEEQLADDVEATHFALLHRQQAQCEIVAVQRQKCATGWRAANRSPLQPLALTPDVLALPRQPPAWSAVQVDEQWLIRHQPWGGMAAENVWLTELLRERGGRARHRQLFAAARGAGRLAGAACADIADPCRTPSGSAETQSAAGGVRRPAAVCAGELASGAVCRAGSGVTGRGQTACWTIAIWRVRPRAAQQASRAFYHRWFPTEKKVINPRLQMQQHLQTLTRQAQHAPSSTASAPCKTSSAKRRGSVCER
ncbi:type II secretion system protein GspL [Klebsiella pneumoniae subsp. pneumoniae]|nr:type II secretion system protein GspL [Klebsiella pneumoniae subsp. pneumoniae]